MIYGDAPLSGISSNPKKTLVLLINCGTLKCLSQLLLQVLGSLLVETPTTIVYDSLRAEAPERDLTEIMEDKQSCLGDGILGTAIVPAWEICWYGAGCAIGGGS